MPWHHAVAPVDTQQVSACHCEERSDGTIRILCGRAQQKAVLWANSSGVTNLPQQQPTCQVSLRGRGLPHQCAHWFAMTCRRKDVCAGARMFGAQGVRNAGACRRVQGRPPLSLRGAKRRGNPYSLRQGATESSTLGEFVRRNEFATTAANLPSFSAGMRIAAPVCALVRNDRLGRCVRTRGQLQCTTFLPGDADCHRCDHWFAMTPPPCHCEERSDVAIRILCGKAQQKAVLWANSSGVTNLPQQQPTCQVSLRGCGLPHQCAHWFAMTC